MRATVRSRSRPFAQTVCLQGIPCTRANASEPERTPNLAILATEPDIRIGMASLTATGRGCRRFQRPQRVTSGGS
jgi:hypothetical protein